MPEKGPNAPRIEDESYIKKVIEDVADQIDDLTTDPENERLYKGAGLEWGNKIRKGEKLEGADQRIHDRIAVALQDLRLTPEERDVILERIFEKG